LSSDRAARPAGFSQGSLIAAGDTGRPGRCEQFSLFVLGLAKVLHHLGSKILGSKILVQLDELQSKASVAGLPHRKPHEQDLLRERMRTLMVRRYLSSVAHILPAPRDLARRTLHGRAFVYLLPRQQLICCYTF
jgi:hypothetical protein